jgi:hypothetical protein
VAAQLFVYYRVRAEHRAAAVTAVRGLHAAWCEADPALACELVQRVEGDGNDAVGLITLMEVYRRSGGVASPWQQRIEREAQAALALWLVGERHMEVFAPCA